MAKLIAICLAFLVARDVAAATVTKQQLEQPAAATSNGDAEKPSREVNDLEKQLQWKDDTITKLTNDLAKEKQEVTNEKKKEDDLYRGFKALQEMLLAEKAKNRELTSTLSAANVTISELKRALQSEREQLDGAAQEHEVQVGGQGEELDGAAQGREEQGPFPLPEGGGQEGELDGAAQGHEDTLMSAAGDPHLSNLRGEHFDLYQPGLFTLLQLPPQAQPGGTLLLLEADAQRIGDECSIYFQAVTISGAWTNQSSPIQFTANPPSATHGLKWKQWMRFGTVDVKVARHVKGVEFINVYAKLVGKGGYEIGGLLGGDDHTTVATRPPHCSHRRSAELIASAVSEVLS
jgi:uncharacterized coiled-coil protein SlyX